MCSRLLLFLPTLALACEPLGPARGVDTADPDDRYSILLVDPVKIDFDTVSVNEQGLAVERFTVENRGTHVVPLRGHDRPVSTAGDPEAFEVDSEDGVVELAPDEQVSFQVVFTPFTDAEYIASIVVADGSESDPGRREEVEVQLRGLGTAPVVEVREQATTVIAGVGCTGEQHVQVRNDGSEDLLITEAVVKESLDFQVSSAPTDPIEPGLSGEILVDFSPSWQGFGAADRTAQLQLGTNDPVRPEVWVTLPAIAYEGADVQEEFVYGAAAQADWLLLVDGPLEGLDASLAEVLGSAMASLDEAGVHLDIAALGPESACPAGSPAFLTNEEHPSAQADQLVASLDSVASWTETSLLQHAVAALGQAGSGGCLEGWRRPQRQLHVLLLTRHDAPEGEGGSEGLALVEAAAGTDSVVVSVLGATGDLGCSGFSTPARYLEAGQESGGAELDLCRSGWAERGDELAQVSLALLEEDFTWFLEEVPLTETIELKADGISYAAEDGWSYDPELNAVVIEERLGLTTGADVVVRYMAALEC